MNKLTPIKDKTLTKADRPCIICAAKDAAGIYNFHHNDQDCVIYRCASCGHMYIDPVPLEDLNSRNMDTVEDAEFFNNKTLQKVYRALIINREIRLARKYIAAEAPRLLDIGCGTGWITSVWAENGFNVTGLESSPVRAKIARERHGLNIAEKHIETYEPEEKYDIVIMRHLLEHIEDPESVIKKVRTFIKPGGVLLVVIPNINAIGRYMFKENFEWVLPWHLHFYNPKNLARFLTKQQFDEIKVYQTPSPLWYPAAVAKAAGGRDTALGRFMLNKGRLIPLILVSPIIFIGWIFNLNDNMTLFFRKPEE